MAISTRRPLPEGSRRPVLLSTAAVAEAAKLLGGACRLSSIRLHRWRFRCYLPVRVKACRPAFHSHSGIPGATWHARHAFHSAR